MDPDNFKQAWQTQTSQTRLTMDADLLLEEVRRKDQCFAAAIFWRDVREVGMSLLMVPLWVYLGVKQSSPWTWYLMVPALLWIAGYMLAYRRRHMRQSPELGEPLRQRVASSLAQVEHQIRLLRNVFWWYLLPFALPALAFFGQVFWQERSGGWWMALAVSEVVAMLVVVIAVIYWLNQYAVRSELEPRRRELETLLMSLKDEMPAAN
jgi:hypothetical protein